MDVVIRKAEPYYRGDDFINYYIVTEAPKLVKPVDLKRSLEGAMVYLDANVFIYPLIYDTSLAQATAAIRVLRCVADGSLPAVTSYLTWDEVVRVVLKLLGLRDAVSAGYKLLAFPKLKLLEVNEAVIFKAQWIIERYSLRPRDAIHAATALVSGESLIVSDDKDFDNVREFRRVGVMEFARNLGLNLQAGGHNA
ncbi:MAG: hypothetical protein DRJ49_05745 [Thermoprotei archaeon]|nr:MAG: hypothetical protein DRJ49_05745 [Thermoprotei archaeon]